MLTSTFKFFYKAIGSFIYCYRKGHVCDFVNILPAVHFQDIDPRFEQREGLCLHYDKHVLMKDESGFWS